MTQLVNDVQQVYERQGDESEEDYPVAAAALVCEGSALGRIAATGLVRQLVAGDAFAGFSLRRDDNTGDAVGGASTVRCRTRGHIVLTIAAGGVLVGSAADNGTAFYASDGATFTGSAGGNSAVGKIERWIAGTQYLAYFHADFNA